MEVKRYINQEGTFDYQLIEDNKELLIMFGGNWDLYFSFLKYDDFDDNIFKITKENMQLFNSFNNLIESIKNPKLHKVSSLELAFCESKEEIRNLYKQAEKYNEKLKEESRYKDLYNNGVVCWHSDEFPYDTTDVVKIYYVGEEIILEFEKNKYEDYKSEIAIRFRNSGSYYNPFNSIFMQMYNNLNEYDPDYHQIHLEEVGYSKKMKHK